MHAVLNTCNLNQPSPIAKEPNLYSRKKGYIKEFNKISIKTIIKDQNLNIYLGDFEINGKRS